MLRSPTSTSRPHDPAALVPPAVLELRRDMERLLAEAEPATDAEALAALRKWFPARPLVERVLAMENWRLRRVG